LDMKAEGILPRNQQVPGERFRVHDRIQVLLLEVKETPRGPQIILSRAHRNFLRRLLENEVPEIFHGLVEIRSIAREPGQRSKVAVAALQPAVDPVGACVGIRGVRIQAIVRELNDEKIDVIEWNSDPALYIAKALSPARVNGVYLNDSGRGAKTATVVVPEDQLSLAIGRDGQNARLAAKLTSWRIDIKSLPEASSDALNKLQSDSEYAFLLASETDTVPQIEAVLAKKAEGRPVTPEEYQLIAQFVDRVERGIIRRRHIEKSEADERYKIVRGSIPEKAFTIFLEDLPFSVRIYNLLSEAGYDTLGSLMLQLELDSDEILALGGIGPKALDEIKSVIAAIKFAVEEEVTAETVQPPEQPEVVEEAIPVVMEPQVVIESLVEVAPGEEVVAVESEPSVEVQEVSEPIEPVIAVTAAAETVEDEEKSLDSLFKLRPEVFTEVVSEDEEEEDELGAKKGKKAKKKKRKFTEVEYDPDRGVMVVKKKRKRGTGDWEDNWNL